MYGRVNRWHVRWRAHKGSLYSSTVYRWPLLRAVHAPFERRSGLAASAVKQSAAYQD